MTRLTDEIIRDIRDRCENTQMRNTLDELLEARAALADLKTMYEASHAQVEFQRAEIERLTMERDEARADASDDIGISTKLLEWADGIDADGDDLRPLLRQAAAALTDRLAQIKSAVDGAAKFAERAATLTARVAELEGALGQAHTWFAEYAASHTAKGDTDKARRNSDRAAFCARASLGRDA
jgi:chromosome segregation ATPase